VALTYTSGNYIDKRWMEGPFLFLVDVLFMIRIETKLNKNKVVESQRD
jgi:hypothetical protein